ncbi:Chitin synthase 8 [Smittium mucronatum]|uniref:chitin synthase n=1 Tax=Smittium mucronatum TaxID=133383 RepID=A0A1R0H8V0_9FUNG|nr:Chitin synthase 8 [Smittium mucronatum]
MSNENENPSNQKEQEYLRNQPRLCHDVSQLGKNDEGNTPNPHSTTSNSKKRIHKISFKKTSGPGAPLAPLSTIGGRTIPFEVSSRSNTGGISKIRDVAFSSEDFADKIDISFDPTENSDKKPKRFEKSKQALQRAISKKSIVDQTTSIRKSLKRLTKKGTLRRKPETKNEDSGNDNSEGSDGSESDGIDSIEGINESALPIANSTLSDTGSVKALVTAIKINNKYNSPYFRIQSSVLVALFPSRSSNTSSQINAAKHILYNKNINKLFGQKYISDYKQFSGMGSTFAVSNVAKNLEYSYVQRLIMKRPHIYKMVTDAYFHLRRLRQNQLFVLSGISGSGKSSTENDILTQICYLSSKGVTPTKNINYSKIEYLTSVIEAFASATTKESFSSTRCGYWREIQFSQKGRIIGQKIITFGLDRWRTTEPQMGERNFNTFYYLIYGANSSMLTKLSLVPDELKYNYLQSDSEIKSQDSGSLEYVQNLNIFKYYGVIPKDVDTKAEAIKYHKKLCVAMYDNTVTSLIKLGINFSIVNSMFQLLGAILHLGNLEFVDLVGVSEAATSKNRNELEVTSRLLGVSSRGLETTLTYKTTVIGGELCTIFMSSFGAARQRDELSRLLYHLMFMWLIDSINKTSNNTNSVNQMAILNMYGAENCQNFPISYQSDGLSPQVSHNDSLHTFENFVVNFANEKIFGYLVNDIFDDNLGISSEMKNDLIYPKKVLYKSHLGTGYLLFGKSLDSMGGLVQTLESHATNNQNSSNDLSLLKTMSRTHSENINFIIEDAKVFRRNAVPTFGINHFFGIQKYVVDGFSKHNSDQLVSTDFITLFQQSSRNRFMQHLFGVDFIRMFLNPSKESSVLEAHVTSNLSYYPTVQSPISLPSSPQLNRTPSNISNITSSDENSKSSLIKHAECKRKQVKYMTTEMDPVDSNNPPVTQIAELNSALSNIFVAASNYKSWHVIHLKPTPIQPEILANDGTRLTKQKGFDTKFVEHQLVSYAIPDISRKLSGPEFSVSMIKSDFLHRFSKLYRQNGNLANNFKLEISSSAIYGESGNPKSKVSIEQLIESFGWESDKNYLIGKTKIFIAEDSWQEIEILLMAKEKDQRNPAKNYSFTSKGGFEIDFGNSLESEKPKISKNEKSSSNNQSEDGYFSSCDSDDVSEIENVENYSDQDDIDNLEKTGFENAYLQNDFDDNNSEWDYENSDEKMEIFEDIPTSKSRKMWVNITNLLTFWIPGFLIRKCGIKRPDVQLAWREKVAICIIIGLLWGLLLFFIIGLGLILCPKQYVYDMNEIAVHSTKEDAYIALRGVAYDITNFMNVPHGLSRGGASFDEMISFAGLDVNGSFPIPVRSACFELIPESQDPNFLMFLKTDPEVDTLFPFIHRPGLNLGTELPDINFFSKYVLPKMNLYKKGGIVWDMNYLNDLHFKKGKYWRVLNGEVFNFDKYFETKNAQENTAQPKWSFLDRSIEAIIDDGGSRSTDISDYWKKIRLSNDQIQKNYKCMKNLFYVGTVDTRKSFKCLFPNYLLLACACVLMLVTLVKFLASLQLSPRRKPQKHDKFVICQVPCYTEGEDSLRKTIEGLTSLNYDDKHKLLFIICDGNIVGSGNTKPTPRIVLDILGVDSKQDPTALSFQSIGDGSKQHNMAKVYSGLSQFEGHSVPFVVVAKVGKPSEKSRPGNRGKRDSQMILLNFLNRVHFDLPMSPLDLEIYHHMKNVIGINPSLYEYILMVDADTVVSKDSLNRLVACMVHDGKILGICGETRISNEEQSWTTMIQVYEYFISHNMAKAFESIFGSVTCLPGCFSMYRIRNLAGDLLIASNEIINEYSENIVDTLHKKNLLSLGEDRYLTTLALKYFPQYKTTFTSDAVCQTVVPDSFSVLLSQRRRWINSTVHNLIELIFLPQLCGFCFFSMRFVVFIDLFGTLTMPCTVLYLLYLAYLAISKTSSVGYISLILIAVIYGLQILLFIVKRQWQHIGWLVIYLLAYPLWSLYIPIYSFWHFDDFSWGNTRIVIGEGGKRQIVMAEDEKFNPSDIPMKTWSEHEDGLLEKHQLLFTMGKMVRDYDMGLDLSNKVDASDAFQRLSAPKQFGNHDATKFFSEDGNKGLSESPLGTPFYSEALAHEQHSLDGYLENRLYSPIPRIINPHDPMGALQINNAGFLHNSIISPPPFNVLQMPQPHSVNHDNQYVPQPFESGFGITQAQQFDTHTQNQNLPDHIQFHTGDWQNLQPKIPNTHFHPEAYAHQSLIDPNYYPTNPQLPIGQEHEHIHSLGFQNQQQYPQGFNMNPLNSISHEYNQEHNPNNFDAYRKTEQTHNMKTHPEELEFNNGNQNPNVNTNLEAFPSNEELEFQIRGILSQVELSSVTIKKVRSHLEQIFGVDLEDRKAFIKDIIQELLQSS